MIPITKPSPAQMDAYSLTANFCREGRQRGLSWCANSCSHKCEYAAEYLRRREQAKPVEVIEKPRPHRVNSANPRPVAIMLPGFE